MNQNRLLNNFIPAAIWLGYHATIPTWRLSFLSLLMLVRAGIVLYCFLIREAPIRRSPPRQTTIAWISTFLPTLMEWTPTMALRGLIGQSVAVSGMILFCFACLDLGRSFGVSPTLRSPVSSGVYRWIPHPMYIAHVIVEAGVLIASPTIWNFAIAGSAWGLYALRGYWETLLIQDSRLANAISHSECSAGASSKDALLDPV